MSSGLAVTVCAVIGLKDMKVGLVISGLIGSKAKSNGGECHHLE
jgi:hypothetical protein